MGAEVRPDVFDQHRPVVARRGGALPVDVLGHEPVGKLGHRRGRPLIRDVGQRVTTAIDLLLEPASLHTRRDGAPVRKSADGDAALAPRFGPVVQNEGPGTGCGDADAEARDLVIGDAVAPLGGWQFLDGGVGQVLASRGLFRLRREIAFACSPLGLVPPLQSGLALTRQNRKLTPLNIIGRRAHALERSLGGLLFAGRTWALSKRCELRGLLQTLGVGFDSGPLARHGVKFLVSAQCPSQ